MNEKEKRYRINGSQFFYDYADGLAIIINSATGVYYGINTFGSTIFNQLVKGASPASILKQLQLLSNCPVEIDDTLASFMTRLQSFGLIIADEQPSIEAGPFDESLAAEKFSFEIEEFAEIQEILLADPIHDVNSDFGWPSLDQ